MEGLEGTGAPELAQDNGLEGNQEVDQSQQDGGAQESPPEPQPTIADIAKAALARNRGEVAPSIHDKAPVVPAPVAYTPNLKFKAVEKEHEMPAFLKDAIKDADTEKQMREIFEKAYGLDAVKPKYQETRQKFEELNKTHSEIVNDVQQLREDYGRGDFDTFFQRLNIPQEKVFQWVLDKVQYQQLPQDQRQVLDSRREAEQRTWMLEKQNQQMQAEYENKVVEATQTALMAELEKPEIKSLSQAYDTRPGGKPGDFFSRVVERGEYAWYSRKMALSPKDAVQEAADLYAYAFKPQAEVAQPGAETPKVVAQPKKLPVIPNISGRPNSPMKAKPKSIEDVRNLYKQMQQQNQ